MAAKTHPSSSSSSDNYDVFLSFRGEDTRGNFTDHLYTALVRAGIRTFRDNEELNHGEEIGPRLLKTIQESTISIPIFSKKYASSKWCLQELTKIMECKKTYGQIVWPIFYKVDPSHVRNQSGCFEEAFLKHKREHGEEKVMTWRKSLKEAGNLKGWDSEDSEYRYETNLINFVVERALSELIKTTLQVAKHPIGIDSHVEEVMRMLDVESEDVQFVGIHGMGGIGKTTTAKAIFNKISKQFESRSFLADVRERAPHGWGLVNLQNNLASDLLKGRNICISNVDSGINVIKKQFCKQKVLIVLDDVDHDEQIHALAGGCDWFGSGSRIIITTRDEHILHVDLVDKSKIYKPNELDKNLSLQLFSKHAFGIDQPPQDFRELSKRVVSLVGGLPLALIVLGSFLRDKREDTDWEDTLKMLKEFPHEEVQKQLKISYDGLNSVFKKLFLDIACFFIGMDKESVILACDVKVGIKVLVHKSLVKIDSDNKLRMHDQLRDMGREIVRRENPKKPGKRSRLWSHEEALDVLKKHKGTRNIEGLFLDFRYEAENHRIERIVKLPQIDLADLLTKASDLRLLQIDLAFEGNYFGHLPQGLKWLSLKRISPTCVPTISHLEKLAVLDLSLSMITDDWNGWQQIQLIRTLKVLDLSRCVLLECTPHFSCDTSLERLILDRCISLVAFHESIKHLQKLVFLSLKCCQNLRELPEGICKLSSIKGLILSHCYNFKKLPNLSNLKGLQALCLSGCEKLFEIQGISGLSLLQQLDLEDCRTLKFLPELPPGLIKLNIRGCTSMERLPNLSTLKKLKELRLDKCYELAKIEGIDGITLLQELDLTDCIKLQPLPELPSSLIKLVARNCRSIERLPNLSIWKNLQVLHLCCRNLSEIQDISGLSLLQKLDLEDCKMLQSLPGLPPSLIRLDIEGCMSMERLPKLSSLKRLKGLRLAHCMKLANIQSINDLTLLQELDLLDCSKLKSLSDLPSSLTMLNVHLCKNLFEIEGLSGLSLLQTLHLRYCLVLQSLPKLPSNLITLDVEDCSSMEKLPDLSNLKILERLRLQCCYNLAEIRGLESLESLIDLRVCGCNTYVKTLPKTVSKGRLPTAFNEGEICNNYLMIPDDDNIKGTIFYFVYYHSASFWLCDRVYFRIEAEIQRNDGKKMIRCFHNLRIEGMSANTDKYRFYSCYFQGLTWFGFPLKKRDKIYVRNASFQTEEVKVKMLDLVMEYEAMEDSQQLEKRVIHLITSTSVEREGARERGDDAGPSSSSSPVGS